MVQAAAAASAAASVCRLSGSQASSSIANTRSTSARLSARIASRLRRIVADWCSISRPARRVGVTNSSTRERCSTKAASRASSGPLSGSSRTSAAMRSALRIDTVCSSDSRLPKWANTDRSETPARSAMLSTDGLRSPS